MALIKEGDWVKRRRYKKDFTFQVERIEEGFATIVLEQLSIKTIEPVRDLIKINRIERIQNTQNNF